MTDWNHRCGCGAATPDGRETCEHCLDRLATLLADLPWLDEQLEVSISRQRGAATTGGASSGETALPWNDRASRARRQLHTALVAAAQTCDTAGVQHSSPTRGLPPGRTSAWTITALSRWLAWRTDGLGSHDFGHGLTNHLERTAATARSIVLWKPRSRVYLGPCEGALPHDDQPGSPCDGEVYAEEDADTGHCQACGRTYLTADKRSAMEAELDSRLYRAAEIARLTTFLGLDVPRDQVRKRVNQWHARKRITPASHDPSTGEPLFRYGEVRALLYRELRTQEGA